MPPTRPSRVRERALSEARSRDGLGTAAEHSGDFVPESGVDDAACMLDGLGEEPAMLVHRVRILVTQRL